MMTYQIQEWVNGQSVIRAATPAETAEIEARRTKKPTLADYTVAMQAMLDAKAREKNYDDIVSACSYAGAPNPFQAEGAQYLAWRGACWALCYSILAQVEAGTRTQPTVAELLSAMPAFGAV